jgi:lysozyme family protein
MALFDPAIKYVLSNEGGFVSSENDPGGVTNYGITQEAFEEYMGRPVALSEMVDMTKPMAMLYYLDRYWNHYHLGDIKSQRCATACLDTMVNVGPAAGTGLIQRACWMSVDNAMGPNTIECINDQITGEFIECLQTNLKDHYRKIVASNAGLAVFLNGWLKRAERLGSLV